MILPPPRLAGYFERWNPIAPHKLSVSSAQPRPMSEILEMATPEELRLWENLSLGYTHFRGHEDLREAITGLYREVGPDDIHTFAGAQEGIFCTFAGLLQPGDHVVTIRPCYEFLETIPRGLGCDVTPVELLAGEDGFRLDLDRFEAAMRPDTKLIAINFPHNPTGAVLTEDELRRIVGMADERGAWLFSDEVFRHLAHGGAEPCVSAADLYERAICLDVMSKSFGLAGIRIGWIATRSAEALQAARNINDYTSITNSATDEILGIIAIRNHRRILDRNLGIIEVNIVAADAFFREQSDHFEWTPPRAGCLAFPKLREDLPVEDLAERLANEAGVLMLPADAFFSNENRFRLGLGLTTLPDVISTVPGSFFPIR